MIASVVFHNFKALREAQVELRPFNLIVGPNGSGKTSLIQALLRLRTLWRLHVAAGPPPGPAKPAHAGRSIMEFRFAPPQAPLCARLSCVSQMFCDQIEFTDATGAPLSASAALAAKAQTRWIDGIRSYLLDHYAMAEPVAWPAAKAGEGEPLEPESAPYELASNGGNLSLMLAQLREGAPAVFAQLEQECARVFPEFAGIEFVRPSASTLQLALRLRGSSDGAATVAAGMAAASGLGKAGCDSRRGELVSADNLSQGTLYLLAMLYLAFQPEPPQLVCIEEIDRGIHPRLLRPMRDLLYRLSYPQDFGEAGRPPVQVLATTHSPYLLDLFKDHPEEIIISHKHGTSAHFGRLSDRGDLAALLGEATLGDLWFSGVLGGVPEE